MIEKNESGKFLNRFYYSAVTQHSNAGDALINRQLVKLMKNCGEVRTYTGNTPQTFLEQIGLTESDIYNKSYLYLILSMILDRTFGKRVYMVLTPGDISASKTKISSFIKTAIIIFLSIIGIRIIQVGISLGNFTKLEENNIRIRSKYMHIIGLRDKISIEKAKQMNLKNFVYFPDLSFGCTPILNKNYLSNRIGLSFRADNLSEKQRKEILEGLKKNFYNKKEIFIIVQVERDLDFAYKIMEELDLDKSVIFESYNLENLSNFYKNISYIVSNRLHVLLLGTLNGATPIAYIDKKVNKKIIGLMESIGLEEYIFIQGNIIDKNILFNKLLDNKIYNELMFQKNELNTVFDKIIYSESKQ